MSNFVETWKGIATALGRSERWCRYMARRAGDHAAENAIKAMLANTLSRTSGSRE